MQIAVYPALQGPGSLELGVGSKCFATPVLTISKSSGNAILLPAAVPFQDYPAFSPHTVIRSSWHCQYGKLDGMGSVYSWCASGDPFGFRYCYFAFAGRDESFFESDFYMA